MISNNGEIQKRKKDFTWSDIALFAAASLIGAYAGIWALTAIADGMVARAPGFWFVSRAAGIAGFLLLWASTAWGIMLSARGVGGAVSRPISYAVHNITSWLALGFAVVHAFSLLGDRVISFPPAAILVPFASSYEAFLTGLGTISLYVGVIVSLAFYGKRYIGYRAWRAIHLLSYLMFAGVMVHGVLLGTDSGTGVMRVLYLAAGGSVLFLTIYRILTAGSFPSAAQPADAARPAQAGHS